MLRRLEMIRRALVILTAGLGGLAAAATGSNHWAYLPLRPTAPPAGEAAHPVDAFLLERLKAAGLAPAREADRRTLLRRVTFDLIGLPPTPDELAAFLADPAPDAYPRAVDRLLGSPRYGERWARRWMDVAHFAETHGNDQDRVRTNAWPYRDYLIESFNHDKPFPRFIQEQVAGDVLFPEDPAATVALGFIAAGPWDESSLRDIREDTLDRQIGRYLDRDDMVATVMNSVASTTVQCARCHDHKFDPVPQRDYYALQAVFAGVDRANRVFDRDPATHARRRALRALQRRLEREDPTLLLAAATQEKARRWATAAAAQAPAWAPLEPETFFSLGGSALVKQADLSVLATGAAPDKDVYTITAAAPPLAAITAWRLEVLTDPSLPHQGPGRAEDGNFHLTEVQLLAFEPGSTQGRLIELTHPSADFNQQGWTVDDAVDGNESSAWGVHPREGAAHQAAFELKTPLTPPQGGTLVFVLKQQHGTAHVLGRFRLSVTGSAAPVRVLPGDVQTALAAGPAGWTDDQRLLIARHVLGEEFRREASRLPEPSLVYAGASDFEPDGSFKPALKPRAVHILRRGEITKPGDAAAPGALSCVAGVPSRFDLADPDDEGARRAAFAGWLTARENPLAWRSIVNRAWGWHFGRGLVDTPNDFGKMGGEPSHPELLDWLAVWFRDEARGSFKALHRLLVTSAAYRRAAGAAPSADPDNRLLSRMTRTRLDAECIHDAILQVSGRIDWRMGGPSDRQFDLQPGIHVTPRVDYGKFDVDSAPGNRRSVYRFLFRTLPDPFMDALDCPAGDQLTGARINSVTVQQALALWNGAFVVRQAEHFAARLDALSGTPERRVAAACELAWGRPPGPVEAQELTAYAGRRGLANLCRLLLNSNEFVFVD